MYHPDGDFKHNNVQRISTIYKVKSVQRAQAAEPLSDRANPAVLLNAIRSVSNNVAAVSRGGTSPSLPSGSHPPGERVRSKLLHAGPPLGTPEGVPPTSSRGGPISGGRTP